MYNFKIWNLSLYFVAMTYGYLLCKDCGNIVFLDQQYAKRLYLRARESIQAFTYRLGEWFYVKWRAVYNNYKPHILRTFDDVETNAWNFAENLIGMFLVSLMGRWSFWLLAWKHCCLLFIYVYLFTYSV